MSDLPELRECFLEILKALPESPKRLRLKTGEASIELDWPDGEFRRTSPTPAGPDMDDHQVTANPAILAPVRSPSVGTFYRAPEPGSPPFVTEGDIVQPGQQIAIIEAMKLMLPVEASMVGRIAKILKANGDPVEYGEPLMELSPPGETDMSA